MRRWGHDWGHDRGHCALHLDQHGQANETRAVPELARRPRELLWVQAGTHSVMYLQLEPAICNLQSRNTRTWPVCVLQTAIVATVAGQQHFVRCAVGETLHGRPHKLSSPAHDDGDDDDVDNIAMGHGPADTKLDNQDPEVSNWHLGKQGPTSVSTAMMDQLNLGRDRVNNSTIYCGWAGAIIIFVRESVCK